MNYGLFTCAFVLLAESVFGGNSLPNSSFEVGLEGYRIATSYAVDGGGSLVSTPDAVDGTAVVELVSPTPAQLPPAAEAYLVSEWTPVSPGTATFSFYARAVEGSPSVTAILRDTGARQVFHPGPDWQRFHLTVPLVLKEPYERVSLRVSGGGRIQVDALQLEPGPLSAYAPPSKPLLGMTSDRDLSLMLPGEAVQVGFKIRLPDGYDGGPLTVCRKYGNLDHDVSEQSRTVLQGSGPFEEHWRWTAPDEPGWHEWRVRLLEGGRELAASRYSVAVVPPQEAYAPGTLNMFSFCLMHDDLVRNVELARRLGVSSLRLHGVLNLPSISQQVSSGIWRDEPLIRYIHDHGMSQYAQLGKHGYARKIVESLNSEWRWNEFSKGLTAMAEHFRGLMQGYEIWNEPSGPLSLEEYAPMHRAMVQALRQGDPSVRLIGLCAMPKHADWIKKTVDEGLGDGLTAISFHDYIRIAPELSMPQVLVSLFGEGKQYLTDAGLSGMPLWDTESGYLQNVDNRPRPQSSGSPKLFYKTIEEQARFTVRQHFLSFAAGLELKSTFFLQSVSYDQWWAWSPFRADALNSALPMSAAYSVMSSLLRDAEPRQVVYEPTGNVYAYAFRDEKRRQSIVALWTVHEPKTVESRLPAPAKVLDLYGRQLPAMPTAAGPDPVYLIWPDDRLPADWPSRLLPESGQFVPYNIWHTDRKQLVVEDENSPKQPPVQADIILPAAESRFFTWDPGVQEVKGAVNDRILVMGPPAKPLTGRMVVEFQANLREGESGSWQIWASIGPMFFHEYSELALQVDGNPPVRIRGLDTPDTYTVTLPSGESAELAWQYFTTVNLTPGVHRIRILSGAELDGKKETVSRQVLDAVILHRVEDKKQ